MRQTVRKKKKGSLLRRGDSGRKLMIDGGTKKAMITNISRNGPGRAGDRDPRSPVEIFEDHHDPLEGSLTPMGEGVLH